MMEHLFRAKTTKKKDNQAFNNVWVEGDLIKNKNKYYIHPHANVFKVENELAKLMVCHEVIPETVGQFTGLTDKNGTKIFEGDIVKAKIVYSGLVKVFTKEEIVEVKYIEGCFYPLYNYIKKEIKVIGNINDNPELLEVKE